MNNKSTEPVCIGIYPTLEQVLEHAKKFNEASLRLFLEITPLEKRTLGTGDSSECVTKTDSDDIRAADVVK